MLRKTLVVKKVGSGLEVALVGRPSIFVTLEEGRTSKQIAAHVCLMAKERYGKVNEERLVRLVMDALEGDDASN